jgi:hypothetical protein
MYLLVYGIKSSLGGWLLANWHVFWHMVGVMGEPRVRNGFYMGDNSDLS